ncbi:polysaccharide deacetylase family protein [Micromonospora sp. KC723]|uniref:polysaccharide deacetylase family protein n=1 Tax=Micromonospora sp. KC723 TaxID=2530381 RepID=UPI001050AB11|nr:polysaccharide deacetylase family protein [Micromonospora sp. KC723]TDB74863.1 polysaccharide deacetylase family protein [Micromonospora sp. KC723]
MTGATGRATGVVALVLAALLGSAYVLGRSLVSGEAPRGAEVTSRAGGVQYAEQPAESGAAADRPTGGDPQGGPDGGSHHAAEGVGGGPFGSRVSTGSTLVALTFDDGPNPDYTPQVLDVLREFGVRATFCVVGENAQRHPHLIRAIVADGHTLCNHSWRHDVQLGRRSRDAIRADLLRTNEAIRAAVPDAPIAWYRQPGGAWTYPLVSVAEELGMIPLHWSVDPVDWRTPGALRIATRVVRDTTAGSIVLLHDAGGERQGTVDALRHMLPELTSRFPLDALPHDSRP